MVQLAWLWKNDLLADVQLQLRTTQPDPAAHQKTHTDSTPSGASTTTNSSQGVPAAPCEEAASGHTDEGRFATVSVAQHSTGTTTTLETASAAGASVRSGSPSLLEDARSPDTHAVTTAAIAAPEVAAAALAAAAFSPPAVTVVATDTSTAAPTASATAATSVLPTPAPSNDPAAADEDAVNCACTTFRLHAIVLMSSSAYFKTRLSQHMAGGSGGLQYADGGGDGTPHGQPPPGGWLLVEHVEAGELDAMEAVLRHGYTGQLGAEGTAASGAAQLSIATLMQMLVLSDRFDMPGCIEHCCVELGSRRATTFSIPDVNAILSNAREGGWRGLAAFDPAVAAATERLHQLLGDADALLGSAYAVPSDADWNARLHQLSLSSLLILLNSNRLKALSENSVLAMADEWVNSRASVGQPPCSEAEARQVAVALRLCHLTPCYLYDVLPLVPWLKLSASERECVVQYVAAGSTAAVSPQQRALFVRGRLEGPFSWYCAERRAAPPEFGRRMMEWDVSRQELAQMLADPYGGTLYSRMFFYNGFSLQLGLFLSREDAVDAGPSLSYRWGVEGMSGGELPSQVIHTVLECGVLDGASGVWDDDESDEVHVCSSSGGMVEGLALDCPEPLEMASWERYLVDDVMHMRCFVTVCE